MSYVVARNGWHVFTDAANGKPNRIVASSPKQDHWPYTDDNGATWFDQWGRELRSKPRGLAGAFREYREVTDAKSHA